ncbi:MAG TPA: class I SAM-dependent methyltransferase [Acetobacteraceae bacterium]|nr:class I SAM-dependent methyltransferase [Acetobacteraceae bacterium]
MAIFETFTSAERARQLGNPEGVVGIAVADWLNDNNRQANAKTVVLLGVEAGHRVLEIGFGNGRTVPDVIAQAVDVHYTGIDISPTMVKEASRFNAAPVAAGRVSFHLGSAERMSFADVLCRWRV